MWSEPHMSDFAGVAQCLGFLLNTVGNHWKVLSRWWSDSLCKILLVVDGE